MPPSETNALTFPFEQPLHRLDDAHPILGRRVETKKFPQLVERHQLGLLGDPNGALALHVAVPADGTAAGTRLPNITSQQQQVHEHRDVERTVRMLGKAHAIDADHLFGGDIHGARLAQRGLGQSRFPVRSRPSS